MPGITNSEMTDLLKAVTNHLPNLNFEYTFNLQEHEVCNRWFAKDKIEATGGDRFSRRIVLDDAGAAKHVRAYEASAINVPQLLSTLSADWVEAQTDWSVEHSEVQKNRSGTNAHGFSKKLVDLAKLRETAAMVSLAEELEAKAWEVPAADTDNKTPLGLQYWIPKLAAGQAVTAAGFYGGRYDSTMGANTGGIPPATASDNTTAITGGKSRWRSYQAGYTSINDAWRKQMRKVFYAVRFKSPEFVSDLKSTPINNTRLYCNVNTLIDIEEYQTKNNDNVGADVAKYSGNTSFKRIPFTYMPVLDTVSAGTAGQYNPIFFVNHNDFKVIVREGDYLRRSEPMNDRAQHKVYTTFVDLAYCFICLNRRHQGCINQIA